jgi:hypothetical protein
MVLKMRDGKLPQVESRDIPVYCSNRVDGPHSVSAARLRGR